MNPFLKFEAFVEALAHGKHDFSSDTFFVQLLATSPDPAADAIETDLPADLATGGGYTSGGVTCGTATSSAQTGGVYKLDIADKIITASGGSIGPFRYIVLINNSAVDKNLIGYYDYGSDLTLNDGDGITIDFDAVDGVLTLT